MPFLNQQKGENDHRKYFMITPQKNATGPNSDRTRDLLITNLTHIWAIIRSCDVYICYKNKQHSTNVKYKVRLGQKNFMIRFASPAAPLKIWLNKIFEVDNFFRGSWTYAENRFYKNFQNLFVLRFYGPINPMGSCQARSIYLTTRLLGRLSPLSS